LQTNPKNKNNKPQLKNSNILQSNPENKNNKKQQDSSKQNHAK